MGWSLAASCSGNELLDKVLSHFEEGQQAIREPVMNVQAMAQFVDRVAWMSMCSDSTAGIVITNKYLGSFLQPGSRRVPFNMDRSGSEISLIE